MRSPLPILLAACITPALHSQALATVGGAPAIPVVTYPSRPFSATEEILQSKSGIPTRTEQVVARDSFGRVYWEQRLPFIKGFTGETLSFFDIVDPVLNTATRCIPTTHVCHVASPSPLTGIRGSLSRTNRTDLGAEAIDGIAVSHWREVAAPGITEDSWWSPELKQRLALIRDEGDAGHLETRLHITSRAEPNPTLFTIPEGYKVIDDRSQPKPLLAGGAGRGAVSGAAPILPPVLLTQPEPEFTRDMPRDVSGTVLVHLVVDEQGSPTELRVARGLQKAVDAAALKAVQKYKFRPATQTGKPIRYEMFIEVDFHKF